MDDECVTKARLSLRLGRYGSQTVVGLPLLQYCSSLRRLLFRLGMDWLCRSTKQGWLSFVSARIRAGPNTCFSTASAAGAAAAAAAACFCCGCLRYCCCCCTICWSCSVFYFLFERSEFLIDTPHKKNLRVCPRPRVK